MVTPKRVLNTILCSASFVVSRLVLNRKFCIRHQLLCKTNGRSARLRPRACLNQLMKCVHVRRNVEHKYNRLSLSLRGLIIHHHPEPRTVKNTDKLQQPNTKSWDLVFVHEIIFDYNTYYMTTYLTCLGDINILNITVAVTTGTRLFLLHSWLTTIFFIGFFSVSLYCLWFGNQDIVKKKKIKCMTIVISSVV